MTIRQARKLFGLAVEERPLRATTRLRAARKLYKGTAALALHRFNEAVRITQWGDW